MNELFPSETVAVKSPRLRWLEKRGVQTYFSPSIAIEDEPWSCWTGDLKEAIEDDSVVNGRTEDEAITAWAIANGVKLWNEL